MRDRKNWRALRLQEKLDGIEGQKKLEGTEEIRRNGGP